MMYDSCTSHTCIPLPLQAEFLVATLGCVYYVQSTRVEYQVYDGSKVLPILNYTCGGFFGVLFLLRLFRCVPSGEASSITSAVCASQRLLPNS